MGRVCFSRSRCARCEVERRATPSVAVGPDLRPPAIRRLTYHRQAHGYRLYLVVKNAREYLVGLTQRKPRSCVIDRDFDPAISPNRDFTVSTPPVSFIASMPFSIRFMSTAGLRSAHLGEIVFQIGAGSMSTFRPRFPSIAAISPTASLIAVIKTLLRWGLFVQRSQTVDDFRGKSARLDDSFLPLRTSVNSGGLR